MADPVSTRYKDALQRGHTAVVKGRPREAIGHYEEAGKLAPDRPLPYVSMGSLLLQMRKASDAIRAFDEALRRAPGDLDAMRGLARALEADGRAPEAAALARRADELGAMEQAGHRRVSLADPGSPDLERHLDAGERARRTGDQETALAELLAAAGGYAERNDFDAAIDACYRALQVRPGAIDVHLAMADLYLRRGWKELGVERVLLIDHRLQIDEDQARRGALAALARDHRQLDPELDRIAGVDA